MAVSGIYDQTINQLQQQRQAQEYYLKQLQANQAKQLQNQVDQTVNQLDNTKTKYKQTYNDNAQSAYVNKMQTQRDLPQQLAAQGVSGGQSESGSIALNTSYGNTLSGYKRNYDDQVSEVDQNIASARNTYNNNLADLYNSYLAKFAENNQYYDQQVQAQQTAKAQAEEEDRQAQIAAQQQAAALAAQQAQAAAKAQATARTKQLNSVLAEAKKRKETSINSAINYLSNQATWGEISDDEYASLISELGITAGQEKAYFTPIPQTGTAAYYYSGRR